MDLVAIALADGVVRGVEVLAGVFDRDDRDVVGQQRVQAAVQIVVREARFGGDADDLAERVDAGVGAAGGGDAERLLRELAARSLRTRPAPSAYRAESASRRTRCRRRHGQLEPARGHW